MCFTKNDVNSLLPTYLEYRIVSSEIKDQVELHGQYNLNKNH